MTSGRIGFEIIDDPSRLDALEAEWGRLWARTAGRRFSHGFTWRAEGWRTTGAPLGRRLRVLVMRLDGEAELIWPLAIRRTLGLWRVAVALGPEFTDYDPLLVADGPDAAAHIRAAWAWLCARGLADMLTAPRVRHDSELHAALAGLAAARTVVTLPSPYVSWDGYADWDAYWRSRSKNTRSAFRRRARRFEGLGRVEFQIIDDPQEYESLLDWTLREKLAWLDRQGLYSHFMHRREFGAFLSGIGSRRPAEGRWMMFALKLDGQVVSTKLGGLDERRFEAFIAVNDPAFATYSVGSIMLAETLKWLMARGLEYDFRIGAEPYKFDWATGECAATNYLLPTGPWGEACLMAIAAMREARGARDRLRATVPANLRRRLKGELRFLASKLHPGEVPADQTGTQLVTVIQ
jgi:CelD/BcsL family acetyltransferase involved in cellulose biosynthesis